MQRIHGVLVRRRQPVFWREPVFHGDDDRRRVSRKRRAEHVEKGGIGVEDYEAATVEVDDDGELLGGERKV